MFLIKMLDPKVQKNILDLKHNAVLNFFNISIILLISSFVSAVIAIKDSWTLNSLVVAILFLVIIIAVLLIVYLSIFHDIRNSMERLKL